MLAYVHRGDGIHVMDDRIRTNLIARYAQIATVVSYDDVVTKISPFPRRVELLVHPTIKAKGRIAGPSVQSQVLVPVFNRIEPLKLSVRPSHRTHEALAPRTCAWR